MEAHETFSEEQVLEAWNEYIKRVSKRGEKILASILKTDKPKIENKVITIVLPNETMKSELEAAQNGLLSFIKRKIRNSDISLQIQVDKELTKKYAFTPRERYEKLKEKNPLIEKLKDIFDLDV